MSFLSKLFGGNNEELAQAQQRLAETQAELDSLRAQGPQVVEREVPVEVPVEVEPNITATVFMFSTKTQTVSPERFATYIGQTVQAVFDELFPNCDVSNVAEVVFTYGDGGTVNLKLGDVIPATTNPPVSAVTTTATGSRA